MFPRKFFSEDHEIFRDATRRFIENEIVPNHAEWEQQGIVSREMGRIGETERRERVRKRERE